jgi:VacB/RNase II family 3'-5' exoribonuclease
MDKYAKVLRKKRMTTGALEIESQEVRFKLDEVGNPLGIILKVSKDANKLIEEFMLLANRRVAAFIGKPEPNKLVIPFLYRTHDEPNEEKIADLKIFLDQFGYKIQHVKDKPISFALNKVMEEAKVKDELHIIGPMVIRSMSKAIYETDNIGHYGLAFDYYSHFTSPIRRYADLLVHRVLFEKLNNRTYHGSKELDAQCKHISATEKEASSAERSSTKYMQVKFMSDKIGQSFEGKITGVTDFGLFVELNETKCEGLVHVSTLQGNFSLNDKTKRLESYQTGESFHLGQAINVVVKNTDIFKKQIDLELAK